jgi:hypothetical protein
MSILPKNADALVQGFVMSHRPDAIIQQEPKSKSTKINKNRPAMLFFFADCPLIGSNPASP